MFQSNRLDAIFLTSKWKKLKINFWYKISRFNAVNPLTKDVVSQFVSPNQRSKNVVPLIPPALWNNFFHCFCVLFFKITSTLLQARYLLQYITIKNLIYLLGISVSTSWWREPKAWFTLVKQKLKRNTHGQSRFKHCFQHTVYAYSLAAAFASQVWTRLKCKRCALPSSDT